MRNSGRLDVIRLLAVSMLLILPATLAAQARPPILEQIAKTYGIDSWDKIEAIRYTWNGEITGLFKASRTVDLGAQDQQGHASREKIRTASR